VHRDDTSDNAIFLGRWPHLLFYSGKKLYNLWKCIIVLRMNHKDLVCGGIIIHATRGGEWYASTSSKVVESIVPGPVFKVKKRGYLPYQDPTLTQTSARVATLKDRKKR
jgi:hypothetical protein